MHTLTRTHCTVKSTQATCMWFEKEQICALCRDTRNTNKFLIWRCSQTSHPTFFRILLLHMRMNEWICVSTPNITIPYRIHSSIHSLYSLLYTEYVSICVRVTTCMCVHDLLLSLDENYYGNRSFMIPSLSTMRLHVNAMASEEGQNSNSHRLLLLVVRYVVRMYACVCVLLISQLLHTHTQAKLFFSLMAFVLKIQWL